MYSLSILVALVCIILSFLAFSQCKKPPNFPPGPTWYPVVGNLPLVHRLHAKLGYFHLVWTELAKQYGPMVGLKLGGNLIVVCNGYEAVKEVCSREECDGKPDGFVFKMRTYNKRLGVGLTDGSLWLKTRMFIVKNLRNLGVGKETMQTIIVDEANDLIDKMKRRCEIEKIVKLDDFSTLIRLSILNSQWTLISGKRFDLEDTRLAELQNLVAGFFKSADFSGGIVNQIPWIRFIAPRWSGYNSMKALVGPLQNFCEDLLEEHKKNFDPANKSDIQGNLIDAYLAMIAKRNNDDPVFNEKQLICVLMDLFMAGPETLTSFLAFMLQYLIQFENSKARILEEINHTIGWSRRPRAEDYEHMPYTAAFIAESQRYSNVSQVPSPHRVMAKTSIMGFDIPKDTLCLLSIYSVHMDKKHWGDPENFRPDRFLDSNGTVFIKDNWLIPFSLGRRRCFGEKITMHTMFLYLVTILQNFEICSESSDDTDSKKLKYDVEEGMTLSPKNFAGIIKIRK